MKKILFLSAMAILLTIDFVTAQAISFQQIKKTASFPFNSEIFTGVKDGTVDFIDVNKDGYPDVLISGMAKNNEAVTKLYLNNNGVFEEDSNTTFDGVYSSMAGCGDINGDGFDDIIFTGRISSNNKPILRIYKNNGNGSFTRLSSGGIIPVFSGSLNLADYDNDGDLDLFLAGKDSVYLPRVCLYSNNGSGVFSLVTGTSFPTSLTEISSQFFDVDGDNDLDIILSGMYQWTYVSSTYLYINNGNGGFTTSSYQFMNLKYSNIAAADIDNDGDNDVIICGADSANNGGRCYIYRNYGSGVLMIDTTMNDEVGYRNGVVAMGDIDGDNDLDLVITGENYNMSPLTDVFLNNGSGFFSKSNYHNLFLAKSSDVSIADIDKDGDNDIFITGYKKYFGSPGINPSSVLYINNGNGIFSITDGSPFTGNTAGNIVYGDIDNDNDADMIVVGLDNNLGHNNTVYINNGNNSFSALTVFDTVTNRKALMFDANNDNRSDVLFFGFADYTIPRETKLFINNGNNGFNHKVNTPFTALGFAMADAADIDGDNDMDLIIAGIDTGGINHTRLFKNDGNGNFTEVNNTGIIALNYGFVKFADFDNDGDNDLIISGMDNNYKTTKLYKNDGSGNFSVVNLYAFDYIYSDNICIEDLNGDSLPDMVLLDKFIPQITTFKILINKGAFSFIPDTKFSFSRVMFEPETYVVADIDRDGSNDILVSGNVNGKYCSDILLNNGSASFTPLASEVFNGMAPEKIYKVDLDNDGYDDIMMFGEGVSGAFFTRAFLNRSSGAGIENVFDEQSSVVAYPNPNHGSFSIEIKTAKPDNIQIEIINISGALINKYFTKVNPPSTKKSIDIHTLPKGIYLIRVTGDNIAEIKKIVVE